MKRFWGLLIALAVLGAAAASVVRIDRGRDERVRQSAERAATAAMGRLDDALATHLASLEPKAAAAAGRQEILALLSTLRRNDDPAVVLRTFADAFDHELWWEPHRRQFDVVGLAIDATKPELLMGAEVFAAEDLVKQAREEGRASGLIAAGPRVRAALAERVNLPARSRAAVLVLGAALDEEALRSIAQRAGGAIVLASAGGVLASAGAEAALAQMKPAITAAPPDETKLIDPAGAWAAVARPFPGALRLWVFANNHAAAGELARSAVVSKAVAGALAILLAGLSLLWGFRGRRAADAALVPPTANAAAAPRPSAAPPAPRAEDDPAAFASTAAVPVGSEHGVFGRYTLIAPLGEGGMARVYTAVTFGAEGFRRRFVVKRLRPELTGDPAVVSQFIDEAKLGSSMVHSNIIPVFDFGKVGEEYYMATEYILGRDLGHLVQRHVEKKGTGLPAPVVLAILAETLKALDYAHNKRNDAGRPLGLVHRDVSPSNILVSAGGEVKLFDFGIVKAEDRITQTQNGVVKGNVSFMSPEQARGFPVDARADLFSLGLVAYFALSGRTLYEGNTMYELLVAAAQGPGPVHAQRLGALPPPMGALLGRVLSVAPEGRFASASVFLNALAPHLRAQEINLAALVQALFADEFAQEEQRFNNASASQAPVTSTRDRVGSASGVRRT